MAETKTDFTKTAEHLVGKDAATIKSALDAVYAMGRCEEASHWARREFLKDCRPFTPEEDALFREEEQTPEGQIWRLKIWLSESRRDLDEALRRAEAAESSIRTLGDALAGMLDALAMGPIDLAAKYGPDAHPDEAIVDAAHKARAVLSTLTPPTRDTSTPRKFIHCEDCGLNVSYMTAEDGATSSPSDKGADDELVDGIMESIISDFCEYDAARQWWNSMGDAMKLAGIRDKWRAMIREELATPRDRDGGG